MRTILSIVGLIGLLLTIFPSILFVMEKISIDQVKWLMGVGMVLWFVTALINQARSSESS